MDFEKATTTERWERGELQSFAEEVLDFTAKRFNKGSDALRLHVVNIENPERWWDVLLDIVPRSDGCHTEYRATDARNWDTADAFSFVMQKAVDTGGANCRVRVKFREVSLLQNPDETREAATRLFGDFDPDIAQRAMACNAVIMLNTTLIRERVAADPEYLAKVICRECIHLVEQASSLILDHIPSAAFDRVTLETYRAYERAVGGADLKRRYPRLFQLR